MVQASYASYVIPKTFQKSKTVSKQLGYLIFSLSRFCFCPPFKISKVNSTGQALLSLARKGVSMPPGITHYSPPLQIKVSVFLPVRLREEILVLFWRRQGPHWYAQVGARPSSFIYLFIYFKKIVMQATGAKVNTSLTSVYNHTIYTFSHIF